MAVHDKVSTGVARMPRRVSSALADPIVQALMAADGVDQGCVEALLRGVAARLAVRATSDGS
jgi:hypothetical protein